MDWVEPDAENPQTWSEDAGHEDDAKGQRHLDLLCDAAELFHGTLSLQETVNLTLDILWRTEEVDQVAVVLGEQELGPFWYMGLRGVQQVHAFLGQECPMPLWGVLARAVVHRPQEGEPDCLIIDNIQAAGQPRPDEFPWLHHQGSLMILPLRSGQETQGALLLASRRTHIFRQNTLRRYIYALAAIASRSLREAHLRERLHHHVHSLTSLHLFTRNLLAASRLDQALQQAQAELMDLFGSLHLYLVVEGGDSFALFLEPEPRASGRLQVQRLSSGLTLAGFAPLSPEEKKLFQTADFRQVFQWALQADQPLFLNLGDAQSHSQDLYYRESGHVVLVPLEAQSQEQGRQGLLFCATGRPTPLDEDDLVVLRTMANSLAMRLQTLWSAHMGQNGSFRRHVGRGDAAVDGEGRAGDE